MGMLAKSVIYGAIAGTAWAAAASVPVMLEWRSELADRVQVVTYSREVAAGHVLAPEDLGTVEIASELADGSAVRQREACVGRVVTCAAPPGAVVVQGCLARGE